MLNISQFFIRKFFPKWNALLTRIIYFGSSIKFGKNFTCDTIPTILIDKGCFLKIGDNVEFKRNVEIRCHGNSNIKIDDNVKIDRGVRILSANNSKIHIEEKVKIGLYSVLNGGDSITIGAKTLVSGFVYIQTSNHGHTDKNISIQDQGYFHSPINIMRDSWLASHVVILPGVTLATGTVVGSNAVVTKDTNPNEIVVGIPAKPIKTRK